MCVPMCDVCVEVYVYTVCLSVYVYVMCMYEDKYVCVKMYEYTSEVVCIWCVNVYDCVRV